MGGLGSFRPRIKRHKTKRQQDNPRGAWKSKNPNDASCNKKVWDPEYYSY